MAVAELRDIFFINVFHCTRPT